MPTLLDRSANALPLYTQLAAVLKERILDGTWPSGASLPTEKELCDEYAVARGTVRQALQKLEEEGYIRREQGRGTFVQARHVNSAGGKLRTGHLAFVVPYVRDSSVSTILIGFQQVAEHAEYSVIFHHVNNDAGQQEQVIRKLVRDGIDGIALYPVDSEHVSSLDSIVRSGPPIVLIDRYLRTLSTDYVMSDHFTGAIRAVHYLMDQGHTRVGFVTWLSPAVSMDHRYLGYCEALRERGIEPDPDLVCHVEGYPTVDISRLTTYLSTSNRPTAVLAANDQIASAMYRATAAVGLSIPQDLGIVGFDNLDFTSHLDPPLTTVAQPFLKIGQTAATLLLERIRGEHSTLHQITLTPELIERQSVMPLVSIQV
ncbi:MAG TPA: GntR family transcriptional regulator [Aggregatilineales bacterium]|nr:GntR family transcriptional regulator [Aggregatilineales bacterium]